MEDDICWGLGPLDFGWITQVKVLSVKKDTRRYYLTYGDNPKGPGILAVISLGSPQRGDVDVLICDVKVLHSVKAVKKWYKEKMKTRPWLGKVTEEVYAVPVPEGLGNVTGLRAEGGKLVADTESGVPMIVPVKVGDA